MSVVKGRDHCVAVGDQRAHVAAKEPVKTNMPYAKLVVTDLQLILILGAKSHGRVIAADGVLPVVRQRDGGLIGIAAKLDRLHHLTMRG
jgi:hypothetical protein